MAALHSMSPMPAFVQPFADPVEASGSRSGVRSLCPIVDGADVGVALVRCGVFARRGPDHDLVLERMSSSDSESVMALL